MDLETLQDDDTINEELATRWQRFWASIIDSLTIAIITLPIMYFTGLLTMTGEQPGFLDTLWVMLVGIAFFAAINYTSLMNDGQTIGKKILKIRIVDLDEEVPEAKSLLIRYAVFFGLGQIPVAGPIANLINIIFIFGKEKRCGHDYLAETKVIQA